MYTENSGPCSDGNGCTGQIKDPSLTYAKAYIFGASIYNSILNYGYGPHSLWTRLDTNRVDYVQRPAL